ncbi:hypothetical protein ACHAXT_012054 [Thalassiosira profunda]
MPTPLPAHSAAGAIVLAAVASVVTAAAVSRWQRRATNDRLAKLEETRAAERTGRIRAEQKLRGLLKEQEAAGATKADASEEEESPHNLLLQCIGTVVSPFTKRMGTPRQGALVPAGRGFIQLRIPVECVEGLELYSHAWILFSFHANTDAPGATKKGSKTKIRPPRGNGIKVGMLATRSPHRPNNIGLSLVKVDRVDKKTKRLYISALDLVHGTPIYDVKPCVPWDLPGHHDNIPLSVPSWVSQDDELKKVSFTSNAEESLERCVARGKLAPLYTSKNGGLAGATKTIEEVLAQDPRASNSNGPNKRGSVSNSNADNDIYNMLFCSTEVSFYMQEDGVTVENITELELDTVERVDGIPILGV